MKEKVGNGRRGTRGETVSAEFYSMWPPIILYGCRCEVEKCAGVR